MPRCTARTSCVAEADHRVLQALDRRKSNIWPIVRDRVASGDQLADHAIGQEGEAKHVLARLCKVAPNSYCSVPAFSEAQVVRGSQALRGWAPTAERD